MPFLIAAERRPLAWQAQVHVAIHTRPAPPPQTNARNAVSKTVGNQALASSAETSPRSFRLIDAVIFQRCVGGRMHRVGTPAAEKDAQGSPWPRVPGRTDCEAGGWVGWSDRHLLSSAQSLRGSGRVVRSRKPPPWARGGPPDCPRQGGRCARAGALAAGRPCGRRGARRGRVQDAARARSWGRGWARGGRRVRAPRPRRACAP